MFVERIERKFFRDNAPQRIHYITPIPQAEAEGLVADVYDQMGRDFQVVPPITVHSPMPKILAGVWGMVRESMMAGPVNRSDREAVAAAVSRINKCPF